MTNVIFADLYPAIAAAAQTPAPCENPAITQTARDAFAELQAGKNYRRFNERLRGKLAGDVGVKFVKNLVPYGASSGAIFKGARQDAKESWYDYVIQFGPGVFLPFAVRVDPDGSVAGFSVG